MTPELAVGRIELNPDRAGASLPGKEKLAYLKLLLELLLLLLALPWLLRELVRNPEETSRRAAKKHLGG